MEGLKFEALEQEGGQGTPTDKEKRKGKQAGRRKRTDEWVVVERDQVVAEELVGKSEEQQRKELEGHEYGESAAQRS